MNGNVDSSKDGSAAPLLSNGAPVDGSNGAEPSTVKPRPARPKKPNYAKIHAKPLPLNVHPLPAFIPQNPLSLLRIAYALLSDFFSPPRSHPACPYQGYFSSETRSIHVTDPVHVRALWEMGFFGKGTLSRSEPSWLERERARRAAGQGGTSEEVTSKRREERRLFKLERARLEREQIEEQLRRERGLLDVPEAKSAVAVEAAEIQEDRAKGLVHVFPWMANEPEDVEHNEHDLDGQAPETQPSLDPTVASISENPTANGHATEPASTELSAASLDPDPHPKEAEEIETEIETEIVNQEHLQLTTEEAFFLSYGLGVLDILPAPTADTTDSPSKPQPLATTQLFTLFQTHSTFPTTSVSDVRPDNPFLLHYAVYHHYRSLGWVVRSGSKFSCDFLLYNRGPVFSHAEFAILIVPEYSDQAKAKGLAAERKDWWWLHCVNRVQSQVRKSLVLCYVQIPDSVERDESGEWDVGKALKGYKVRDFIVRRWLANRSRD